MSCGGCEFERPAAEMRAVLVAGMRADGHPCGMAGVDGRAHSRFITGMAAAGDVCGACQRNQCGILRASFPEIGVEIDAAHGHTLSERITGATPAPPGVNRPMPP